jgi:hypothetical protein
MRSTGKLGFLMVFEQEHSLAQWAAMRANGRHAVELGILSGPADPALRQSRMAGTAAVQASRLGHGLYLRQAVVAQAAGIERLPADQADRRVEEIQNSVESSMHNGH